MNKWYTKDEILEKFQNYDNELFWIAFKYNSSKLLEPDCTHYLKVYHEHLKQFRDKPISILEIGVKDGDSLKMWKDYFHKDTKIYGIEYDRKTQDVDFGENVKVFYGDQSDLNFLADVIKNVNSFDVIIDDGGHTQHQIISSFFFLFQYGLVKGGYYFAEDLGTSYWHKWSGGYRNPNTAIEFFKNKVDCTNYSFWKGDRQDYIGIPEIGDVDPFDRDIESIHFYKGLCLIRKKDGYL